MIRFSQGGEEVGIDRVNVYFIGGYIEAFLRTVSDTDPATPLKKNHRESGRFRIVLERTGPREIAFTAHAHAHTLGLLVDYIWTYEGAVARAVDLGTLAGTIPLPEPRP